MDSTTQILAVVLISSLCIGIFIHLHYSTSSLSKIIENTQLKLKVAEAQNTRVSVPIAMANISNAPLPNVNHPQQIAWQCVPGINVPVSTSPYGEIQCMGNNEGTDCRWGKTMAECQSWIQSMHGVDPLWFQNTAVACPQEEDKRPEWCRLAAKLISAQPTGPTGMAYAA
jgi:hypothetical protein